MRMTRAKEKKKEDEKRHKGKLREIEKNKLMQIRQQVQPGNSNTAQQTAKLQATDNSLYRTLTPGFFQPSRKH